MEGLVSGPLIPGHPRWWGDNERPLDPPKSLLRWLIRNLKEPPSERLWGTGETRTKRERLLACDKGTIDEALRLPKSEPRRSAWYVLEGQSRPDACLETESLILLIEGKRTERESTTTTTRMKRRSQILRHMDAARELPGNKKTLGLMIVEGPGGADAVTPSEYWQGEADAQVEPQMLKDSLPHRTPQERELIAEGFLGVTTWQRVCSEFRLSWPPAADDQ